MKPIQVFLRQCYYSKLQELPDRTRPFWFDKQKVFQNFKNTIDSKLADYHIIYDEHYGNINDTFLKNETNVKIINTGNECESFVETLDYVKSQNYSPDTIVYFLEDDYAHRPGWCKILLEGFTINCSYVTLYDFNHFLNDEFMCRIFATESTHWRAVPATTNTFACRFSTILEDYQIHKDASLEGLKDEDGFYFTRDCEKFKRLSDIDKYVISCLPGYSTHCVERHLAPYIDWRKIINTDFYKIKTEFMSNYR